MISPTTSGGPSHDPRIDVPDALGVPDDVAFFITPGSMAWLAVARCDASIGATEPDPATCTSRLKSNDDCQLYGVKSSASLSSWFTVQPGLGPPKYSSVSKPPAIKTLPLGSRAATADSLGESMVGSAVYDLLTGS